ncbi:hypothetical protein [Chromohalobacter israelensis]|uniref:hypothetical protein n=1 Tax=Chromohalobacter israelensis TaxID=141390 RepID=UPI000FFF6366|nr:hypothetical protein [Chromohalobacter salexigens]RXE48696.1 hypothetical protein B4O83_12250 [Chromohalobacter salexigens]
MTDTDYEAWLADLSATRCVLCELDYAGGSEYVASRPFISRPTDSDPNRVYDDLLAEAVDIETRTDGLISFGEISLIDDGSLWRWVNRAWQGYPIRLYLGGPDWSRDDFRLHARGINNGITAARRGELAFEMIDQSAALDEPIDTGSLPDDAGPVPLALGRVYNAPLFRVSSTSLTYRASYLAAAALTPKDSGNPVPHSESLAGGTVTLDNAPGDALTVDIIEAHDTPAEIAQWVADRYGLTVGEIALPGYAVGLYYDAAVTGRQILDELCQGLGAYWYLDALGQLVMRQHVIPNTADVVISVDDIEDGQIGLVSTEPPWSSLTLQWGRNYAPLRSVAGVIEDGNATEAARLKRTWSESVGTQSVTDHPLADDATRSSCIQTAADAATERDRLLGIRTMRADVWEIDAFLPPVHVGMSIEIDHPLTLGMIGRLVSVSRAPTRSVTTIQAWFPSPWPPGELGTAVDALDVAVNDTLPTIFAEA